MKNMSTFNKLLVTFLMIILPMILLGSSMILINSRRDAQNMYTSVHTQMTYWLENYEDALDRVQKLTLPLLNNQDLKQLANLPESYSDFEKSRAILRLQHELNAVKSSQNYIYNVRVLIPSIGWALNADGYSGGSYTEIREEAIETLSKSRAGSQSGLIYENGCLLLRIASPGLSQKPEFVIEVEYSPQVIRKDFMHAVNFNDSFFLFTIPEEDFLLTDMDRSMTEKLGTSATGTFRYDGREWYYFSEKSEYLNGIFYKVIPAEGLIRSTQTLVWMALLFFAAVIVCIWAFFRSAWRLVNEPLQDMVKAFQIIENGDFTVKLNSNGQNDFGYLYRAFNNMAQNLQNLIDKVYNQKVLLQKIELKQLQAQINPHFLYNSYFLLHRLIKKEDYQRAVLFSKEMGGYFRYITRNGRDVVELEEENGHARVYAQIQGMRFEGRIRVEYGELPVTHRHLKVPRLVIQPILENAFGYGLENKEENGLLRVSFEIHDEDEGISILVEDNGEQLTDGSLDKMNMDFARQPEERDIYEVTGIVNINRRMKIFYGESSGLYVTRSVLGGLCAELRIIPGTHEEEKSDAQTFDRG